MAGPGRFRKKRRITREYERNSRGKFSRQGQEKADMAGEQGYTNGKDNNGTIKIDTKDLCIFCYRDRTYHCPIENYKIDRKIPFTGSDEEYMKNMCSTYIRFLSRYRHFTFSRGNQQARDLLKKCLARWGLNGPSTSVEIMCCPDCFHIVNEFCEMYKNHEKLLMKMEYNVARIGKIMKSADRVRERTKVFNSRVLKGRGAIGQGERDILNCFRTELLQKCTTIPNQFSPMVGIEPCGLKTGNSSSEASDTKGSAQNIINAKLRRDSELFLGPSSSSLSPSVSLGHAPPLPEKINFRNLKSVFSNKFLQNAAAKTPKPTSMVIDLCSSDSDDEAGIDKVQEKSRIKYSNTTPTDANIDIVQPTCPVHNESLTLDGNQTPVQALPETSTHYSIPANFENGQAFRNSVTPIPTTSVHYEEQFHECQRQDVSHESYVGAQTTQFEDDNMLGADENNQPHSQDLPPPESTTQNAHTTTEMTVPSTTVQSERRTAPQPRQAQRYHVSIMLYDNKMWVARWPFTDDDYINELSTNQRNYTGSSSEPSLAASTSSFLNESPSDAIGTRTAVPTPTVTEAENDNKDGGDCQMETNDISESMRMTGTSTENHGVTITEID